MRLIRPIPMIFIFGALAFASDTATLEVTVVDRSGALIPNANVVISDTNGSRIEHVTSAPDYKATQSALEIGKYRVEASAAYFEPTAKDIVLQKGTNKLQIQLEVACHGQYEKPARLLPENSDERLAVFFDYSGGLGAMGLTARIFQDGTVKYKGVQDDAEQSWHIGADEVLSLLGKLHSMSLKRDKDSCASILDAPSRELSFNSSGQWFDFKDEDDPDHKTFDSMQRMLFSTVGLHERRHKKHSLALGDPSAWEDAKWFDKEGMTDLMRASIFGDSKELATLISKASDVSVQDASGWSALMLAAYANCYECVELLLRAGARIDDEDKNGATALMVASTRHARDSSVLELLLQNGADPKHADKHGQTALHWAAGACNAETISQLLEAKSDKFARDRDGKTPLDLALISSSFQGETDYCAEAIDLLRSPM